MSYDTLRKALIETGVISPSDKGKGNRKHFKSTTLKPFFEQYGYPRELTLMLQF